MATREFHQLINALRTALKARKITYATLAKRVGLSERSIKRIMGGEDCGFAKLVAICEAIGITFFDLVEMGRHEQEDVFVLSEEQEIFLATNPMQFAVINELLAGNEPATILHKHPVTKKILDGYFRDLEDQGMLERYPAGKVKLTFRGAHNFRTGGALTRAFSSNELKTFYEQVMQPKQPGRCQFFTATTTKMTKETAEAFKREVDSLAKRYRLRTQTENTILPKESLLNAHFAIGILAPFQSWYESIVIE